MENILAVQEQFIESMIYEIRGRKIMLDFDLAEIYNVPTKSLNLAVKRNRKRFPPDFMFQLSKIEWEDFLRFQFETSKGRGGTRYFPYAFTEQGVAMLSGILNSDRAIEANITIMRTFVLIRQYALSHKDLTEKIMALEQECNQKFNTISEAIDYLLKKNQQEIAQKQRRRIGYKMQKDYL